jgi:hypothetical protein
MATGMQRWAGTAAELARLRRAVERNCSRSDGAHPWDEAVCPAHGLLARQSALDHLLYAYRARALHRRRAAAHDPLAVSAEEPCPPRQRR